MANQPKNSPSRLELIQNGIKKLYKVNKKLSITLIVWSVIATLGQFPGSFDDNQETNTSGATAMSSSEVAAIAIFGIFIVPAVIVFGTILQGMISYAVYQATKDKKPSISEAFEAAQDKFWTILWLNIIIFFRVLGGLLLLIVPGIRAGLRYTIAPIILFDENLSAKDTANRARDLAKNNLNSLLIMNIVSGVIFPITYLIYYGSLVTMYPHFKSKFTATSKAVAK